MTVRPVRAEFHAGGQTEGHGEDNCRFSHFLRTRLKLETICKQSAQGCNTAVAYIRTFFLNPLQVYQFVNFRLYKRHHGKQTELFIFRHLLIESNSNLPTIGTVQLAASDGCVDSNEPRTGRTVTVHSNTLK
jgi:hypothetical protein